MQLAGRRALASVQTIKGLIAFALISVGALISHRHHARPLIRSLVVEQVAQNGLKLLPLGLAVAAAVGLVVVGQIVTLLTKLGATQLIGPLVVTLVIRELAPLITAFLVLGRSGTNTVVQLGTSRALGEVEALETLAIDPIHYLVVPRILGLATVRVRPDGLCDYGHARLWIRLFAFLTDTPLTIETFAGEIFNSLTWFDFTLLGIKTAGLRHDHRRRHLLRRTWPGRFDPARSGTGLDAGAWCWASRGCLLLDAVLVPALVVCHFAMSMARSVNPPRRPPLIRFRETSVSTGLGGRHRLW